MFSIGLALSPAACGRPETVDEPAPLADGVSRYPVTDPAQVVAPETGSNPWISGFDEGTASGGRPSAEGSSGGSSPASNDSDPGSDPEKNPLADASDGGAGEISDPDEPDPEVDLDQPVEPDPILVRRLVRYLEGEGSDKLLGFFGEAGVSPVECRVEIYSNGGTSPWRSIPLPNEFPEGGSLTLCSLPESHPECTANLSGSLYNGNDALVLVCGDIVMDVFGRVGEDPGEAWTNEDETLSTEGQDLVRCGDDTRLDPFSPFELVGHWVRVENGESPEEARMKCGQFGAPPEGGAGAFAL